MRSDRERGPRTAFRPGGGPFFGDRATSCGRAAPTRDGPHFHRSAECLALGEVSAILDLSTRGGGPRFGRGVAFEVARRDSMPMTAVRRSSATVTASPIAAMISGNAAWMPGHGC